MVEFAIKLDNDIGKLDHHMFECAVKLDNSICDVAYQLYKYEVV